MRRGWFFSWRKWGADILLSVSHSAHTGVERNNQVSASLWCLAFEVGCLKFGPPQALCELPTLLMPPRCRCAGLNIKRQTLNSKLQVFEARIRDVQGSTVI